MIVVSTEILAALFLEGELTAVAEAVLRRDPAWASPLIWRALLPGHLADALSLGRLDEQRARQIARSALIVFRGREFPAPLEDNLERVIAGCPPLLAPYVSLASGLGVILVTTSADALRAFPAVAVAAVDFAREERAPAQ